MPVTRKIEHLNEQVKRFFAERCELGKDFKQLSKELFAGYIDFCRLKGEIEKYPNIIGFTHNLGLQSDLFSFQKSNSKRFVIGARPKQ